MLTNCASLAIFFLILIAFGGTELNKGKYDGLKVFINPDVDIEKNEQENFISKLKTLLTDASAALYTSSHDMVSLGNIEIIIPEDWKIQGSSVVGMNYVKPDIEVSGVGLGGNGPYTVQGGQCGGPGLKISLPKLYVTSESLQTNYGNPGKFLANELLKMRYGVYDEFGYSSTRRPTVNFYDWVLSKTRATGCYDVETLQGEYRDRSGKSCDPDRYDTECRLEVSSSGVDYSTLYVSHIDKVTRVCNGSTHDPSPPTIHNLVCSKSALSVMLDHPDFQDGMRSTSGVRAVDAPTFSVQKLTYLSTMFILDINGETGESSKSDMENILGKIRQSLQVVLARKSIPKFGFAYIKGNDSESGGVTYDVKYFNDRALTDSEEISVQEFTSFFPQTTTELDSAPIGEKINEVVDLIEKEVQREDVSVLVIELSNAMDVAPDLENITNKYFISSVLYGNESKNTWLKDFTEQYEGNYYHSFIYDGRAASSSILSIASDADMITHFQEKITANDSYKIDVYLDETAGMNTVFEAKMEVGLLQGALLINPGGDIVPQSSVNSFPFGIGQSSHFVADAEEGLWSYILVMGAFGIDNVFTSSVTSQRRDKEDSITADLWTSAKSSTHDLSESPLAFFVSLKRGANPIAEADVFLRISVEDSGSSEVELFLFDDGNHAPDLRKDDGIYSGYLYDTSGLASEGEDIDISVDIVVSSNNPQHDLAQVFRENTATPYYYDPMPAAATMSLTRQVLSRYSLTITGASLYDPPPSKIVDFSISTKMTGDGKTVKVKLSWTSPGENFTEGTVSSYDIRVVSEDAFTENFEEWTPVEDFQVDISEAGQPQSTTISLEKGFKKQYIGIRGVDRSGNKGQVSPIKAVMPLIPPDSFVGSAAFVFLIIFCITAVVAGIGAAAYFSLKTGDNPVGDLMSRFRRDG